MVNNDVFVCSNKLRPATGTSGLAAGIARKFEQELTAMVEKVDSEEFTPVRFREFLGGMHVLLAGVGREAITQILESLDQPQATVEIDGQRLRYRGLSESVWLSAFGRLTVLRRTYRGDGVGAASAIPLDNVCGMAGRFMTPDVEEMAAFAAAMLTANEAEQLLAKTLPEAPSATAIQNAVRRIGTEIEERRTAIEAAIDEQAPLSLKGDMLVVSFDGVMAPMREGTKVAWREAGVGTISIYGQGEEGPEKLDTRFLARMPESGMVTLLDQIDDQVVRAKNGRSYRQFAVICDGKDTIWSAASRQLALHDAVWILDFYHASETS